jgi:hypothetical protein
VGGGGEGGKVGGKGGGGSASHRVIGTPYEIFTNTIRPAGPLGGT